MQVTLCSCDKTVCARFDDGICKRLTSGQGACSVCESNLGGSKPPRQATKVPLCTNVGPNTEQHNHIKLLNELNEAKNVSHAIPGVLPGIPFVVVPWYVQLQGS